MIISSFSIQDIEVGDLLVTEDKTIPFAECGLVLEKNKDNTIKIMWKDGTVFNHIIKTLHKHEFVLYKG